LAELEDQTGHPDAAADTLEWVIDLDRYADTPDAGRAPRRGLQVGQRPSCASSVSARSVRPRQGDPASLLNKPLRGRRRPQTVPAGTTQWIHAPLLSHTPASSGAAQQTLTGQDALGGNAR
jgi:hypothetical protein